VADISGSQTRAISGESNPPGSPPGGSGDALYIAVVISPRDDRDGRDDDGQARAPRVSREDGKAAGASAHAARMPGSHTPETRTSFAAVKRTRDADHHARSRLRATMSSSPDHAHSMSVRRGPASCGRRAHGHGGTTCRRECSRAAFFVRVIRFFSWMGWEQSRALSQVCRGGELFLLLKSCL
jgi:hypothetical protein